MKKISYLLSFMVMVLQSVAGQSETAYSALAVNHYTSHQKEERSLSSFLSELERKFKVYFNYDPSVVKYKVVNENLKITADLDETLRFVLNPLNLRYEKVGGKYYTIIPNASLKTLGKINEKPESKKPVGEVKEDQIAPKKEGNTEGVGNIKNNRDDLSAISVKPLPARTITGKVLDEVGEVLVGVSVSEKGTQNGTVSNADGRYEITISNDNFATLVFSFVGYENKEVSVGNQTILDVTMTPSVLGLKEVVVVGYGEQKRRTVSSAIATVDKADLENRPTTNAFQALQGLAGNVTIQQNNAEPGAIPVFNIRGVGTFSSNNEPLILVDGVNVGSIGFANLNPNDIENVTILKDASSGALYGSQAGAGVVLVTTKKGKADQKPTVRYSGLMGFQNPTTMPKPVEGWEFMTIKNEALVNSGLSPQFSPDQIKEMQQKGSYPWMYSTQIAENAPQSKHDISVTGGGKYVNYLASFGYFDQQSLLNNEYVKNNNNDFYYKRYNARLNLSTQINDMLKMSLNTAYAKSYNRNTPFSMDFLMRDALRSPRIYPLVNADGTFPTTASLSNNTVALMSLGGFKMLEGDNVTGTFDATLTPLAGLKFNVNVAGNYFQYNQSNQVRAFSYTSPFPSDPPRNNQYSKDAWRDYNTNIFFTGEYEKSFGRHTAKILGGYRSDYFSSFDYLSAYRFNTVVLNSNLFTQGGFETSGGNVVGNADRYSRYSNPQLAVLNSYFGRLNYNFDEKYMLEFTWRFDGSSKLAPESRWLFYPAMSAAWRLTNENFMEGFQKSVGNVKLRFSHGKVGNSGIGGYLYIPRIQLNNGTYSFNNTGVGGVNILPFNSDLQWASVTNTDIGADFELFKNKLTLSFDYFRSLNDGIYYSPTVPGTFGQGAPVQNFATVLNRGWEVTAGYNFKTGGFNHNINFNVADNFNTIQKLGADNITEIDSRTILREGFPISSYFMFKNDGLFQNLEQIETAAKQPFAQNGVVQPGDIRYVDKNEDGVIDAQDRFILGNPFPRYTFGFTYRTDFKGFDFLVFLQGVGERSQYLRGDATEAFHNNEEHLYVQHKDRWTPTNPDATYPRITATSAANSNNIVLNDYWLYNTQYMRVKNIQLGYSLPLSILEKIKLKTARIYVSGQNLFTLMPERFAKLGFDPEFTQFNNNLSFSNYAAIAGRSYPNSKVFAVGIDVSF